MLFCFGVYYWKRKKSNSYKAILKKNFGAEGATLESLQFNLATIEAATDKFSLENRIGKGGFGEVYMGILPDGSKIAVKRLSEKSSQGLLEFKNEVLLIAKLQHRNLVALLGFCLKDQEKILVYEYVPNKSLDYFLFGSQKSRVLNWPERHKIIGGIARGVLYLHEYSRIKIIHRDLKPSNILLDDEMNPKISDFGMARIVGINETRGNTNRIVGTLGYMSPEYIKFGLFSEKSDVYSFGVIVLEIISGKNISSQCESHESQYVGGLLSDAWKHWRDDNLIAILDSNLTEAGSHSEIIKCIHIGLLCVQGNPGVRPSMNKAVQYLSNDSIQLPIPQEPAFFIHSQMGPAESSRSMEAQLANHNQYSINEMSENIISPR
ncbi:cysteine-rich receptor-like protein kinase 10 [Neltuma alba]|uniref:cysteine-rich receptor-like protein kinase 10 n=1 Tax=Neltuma alba TaxID=207710 RepID=UPI0010A4D03F|nr:cysteine-rich receptor-like protein kinase 10 [Prosopis alba]